MQIDSKVYFPIRSMGAGRHPYGVLVSIYSKATGIRRKSSPCLIFPPRSCSRFYPHAGPPLAARYLIPALVDCLGRLAIAPDSNCHPPVLAQAPSLSRHPPPVPAQNTAASATPPNDLGDPPRVVSGATNPREGGGWSQDGCPGDPASRALFHYCNTRDATAGDPDLGIGRGESFLVLSKSLGEICLRVRRSGAEVLFWGTLNGDAVTSLRR